MIKTRFYRHYKNKPYKYLGVVHHSETLEEMALYETLYPNPTGSLWVRPKKMFFEKIVKNGAEVFRFEPVEFKFTAETEVTSANSESIKQLATEIFGQFDAEKVQTKLIGASRRLIQFAQDGRKVVGFKVGYSKDDEIFYSWLGGVLPSYSNLGLASELMRRQHQWAKENGFKVLQTKSRNRFHDIIRLNLKSGFEIVGTEKEKNDDITVLFQKTL